MALFYAKTLSKPFALAWLFLCITSCSTVPKTDAPSQRPGPPTPRWEVNEVPYEEARMDEKIGRNIRDGLLGIIDNVAQGIFCIPVIASQTGFFTQKLVIFCGDVIGLVDDNPWSEHIFKGIISKQLLKFGSRARSMPRAIEGIHETRFEYVELGMEEYIGDKAFHGRAYIHPSAITTLGTVVIGDFLIRPTGNLILIFGFRNTSKSIDQSGLDFIEAGLNVPFL